MKITKKFMAVFLSIVTIISAFSFFPSTATAKPNFTKLQSNMVATGRISKKNKTNYFELTIKEKSRVSLLAYNGNLNRFYKLRCKIFKDEALTKRVFKTKLRVTDTDVWGPYKKLEAGTYYITLSSKKNFRYYLSTDILPAK